jgi:hypothetical protein
MNDAQRKAIRYLLRPFASPRRISDRAYMEALKRLDERALGEGAVEQMRHLLESLEFNEEGSSWKDPTRASEFVKMAKALHAARRISRQEYVLYAVGPVEHVHDGRWLDGAYDADLEPISNAIEQIERNHGLKEREYWRTKDAPAEYIRLNEQYEAILNSKFRDALIEFDLGDILAVWDHSPDEFRQLRERGRRSVFHRNEHALAIQDVVARLEKEARRAASAQAYSAAITALGAGVEGLLLLRCLQSRRKAVSIARKLPKLSRSTVADPSRWTFETLIEVCLAAGWLPPIESDLHP